MINQILIHERYLSIVGVYVKNVKTVHKIQIDLF